MRKKLLDDILVHVQVHNLTFIFMYSPISVEASHLLKINNNLLSIAYFLFHSTLPVCNVILSSFFFARFLTFYCLS